MSRPRPLAGIALAGLVASIAAAEPVLDPPPRADASPFAAAEDGEDAAPEDEVPEAEPAVPPDGPTPAPSTPAVLPPGAPPASLLEVAREVRTRPLAERIAAISEPMLGLPHTDDPLGEGRGHDADPLARYDTYDCLTFVEEVLSLALSGEPTHAAPMRLGFRYGAAEPAYPNRRHFMELQWLPGNIADGRLIDTTTEYGETTRFERAVTDATWKAWGRRSLFALTDAQLPTGTMALDVLSLDAALAVVDRIRPGSIVATVREDRSWVPIWITHVGFALPGEHGPVLRHATRMPSSLRVRDHGLAWYLEHVKTYKNWKVAGIAIFEPVEQGPRRARLP